MTIDESLILTTCQLIWGYCMPLFKDLSSLFIYIYKCLSGLMSIVFASDPGDRGSIPDKVIPKT